MPAVFAALVVAGIGAVYLFGRAPPPAPEPTVPAPPWIRPVPRFVRDIDQSEEAAGAIAGALRKTVINGIRTRDWALVRSGLAADIEARFPGVDALEVVEDPAVQLHRVPAGSAPVDVEGLIAALKGYFQDLATVERASFRVFRSLLDSSRSFARVSAHLELAGVRRDGARAQWYGSVDCEVVAQAGTWRLRRLAVIDGSWTVVALPAFQELSRLVGFAFHASEDSADSVQRMIDVRRLFSSGGLTVLDYDDDGFWDIIATRHYQGAVLFKNDRTGGFTHERLEAVDAEDAGAKMFLTVDLDNDGVDELVSTHVFKGKGYDGELALYRRTKSGFVRKKGALKFDTDGLSAINYEGVVTCDVNGDDKLDLLFIGYNTADSGKEAFSNVDGVDGLKNLLFINRGRLRFSEEAQARGLGGSRYSFVAECFDFDEDGDVDLFIGNDYGQNNFYDNDGAGQFVEDLTHPFHHGRGFSMGLSMSDYDNTGSMSVSISNMYSHAGNRIVPLVSELKADTRQMLEAFAAGNTLFERQGDTWVDRSQERKVAFAEWAWGNVFFDFDNDNDKDLFVANGFTTHSDPTAPDF